MTNILFVDDEPKVLAGLRRMLHGFRDQWDMDFVAGGQEALDIMSCKPYDVVVTDMRMPGMDGAELLDRVLGEHPNIVRIVLSGQSNQEMILRAIGPAHQYLSKPCDPESLKHTVARACALRDQLGQHSFQKLVSRIQKLPSLPSLYREMTLALKSPNVSIERVAEIVSQDLGMSSKMLQLVNSSFFGLSQRITSPAHATSLLGLNLIRQLVLTVGVFSQFDETVLPGFSIESLINHSLTVATSARNIAAVESDDEQLQDDAFLAGLLHDVGKLILAANLPEEYHNTLKLAREKKFELWDAELETLGTTHAEVGGYLLGLWGIPYPVVEAVTFHHIPVHCPSREFTPLLAVHVANTLQVKRYAAENTKRNFGLDMNLLTTLGLADRVEEWKLITQINDLGESMQ